VQAFTPSPEFLARKKRVEDAFSLRQPDRTPVAPVVLHYYPTRVAGISNKDAMYHYDRRLQALKDVTIEHDWDAAPPAGSVPAAKPLEILGVKQIKWPGGAISDELPFQMVENEYMLQSEYDELFSNTNRFVVEKLWPRIADSMALIGNIFETMNNIPLISLSNFYSLPGFIGGFLSQAGLSEIPEKLLELSQETQNNGKLMIDYNLEMMRLGYPFVAGAFAFCAFDWISDFLRGLRGTSLDMYQVPDKLLKAIEIITPLQINGITRMAQQAQVDGAVIFLHRGSEGFMSDEQFSKFYWPCLRTLTMGLIDAGIRPIVYTEGDYTARLKYFQDLPPKKFVMHYQDVDRRLAKQLLGDISCFWGNVSSALMCTGTPEQVKDDVKELIDIFGDNGGLVIDSTIGIPDESRPENVQALSDAVREFGVY
jgi:hypothetical protein